MNTLLHAEVWSDWPFATGATRLALLPGIHEPEDTWRRGGEGSCTAKLLRGDVTAAEGTPARAHADAYGAALPGRVVVFVRRDGSKIARRIVERRDATDDGGVATLRLLGLSSSLAKTPPITLAGTGGRDTFRFDGVGLSLSQHLTNYLLPATTAIGLDFLAAGVITATGKTDIPYDGDNAWTAIQKIEQQTDTELSFRWDWEAEVVYLDFLPTDGSIRIDESYNREADGSLTIVANKPVAAATFGDQLVDPTGARLEVADNLAVSRTLSEVEQTTRLYGSFQNGATIAEAIWLVADVTGDIIELVDLGGGAGPILVNDQLNGLYLEAPDRITRSEVMDSDAAAQTVTVDDGSLFDVGDRVRFRADSAGAPVLFLEDVSQIVTLAGVLTRSDIPETVNLVDNADQSVWTGAGTDPADGWVAVGTPTLTRTTTAAHVETGQYSCRVQGAADGDGYTSPLTPVSPNPFVSGFVAFKVNAGQVRVEMVVTDGVDSWVFPDGTSQKAITTASGAWVKAGVAGIDMAALGITHVRMRVVQDGATAADFYVDAAQVTESAGQLPLVIGAGPTQGWQAVNAELAIAAPTRARYEGKLLDFHRLDPVTYPDKALIPGALHVIRDPSLGIVEGVRLVEITERLEKPAETTVVLSSLASDLRSIRTRLPVTRQTTAIHGAKIVAASSGARIITDAVVTASDATLTSVMADFTAADVAATIWVIGAGASGGILKTVIDTVTDEQEIEMTATSVASLTNATAIIGTPEGVLTLAVTLTGGADGRDGSDADARNQALIEAQMRELARRIAEIESGAVGEQGPPGADGTVTDIALWTEGRAVFAGTSSYKDVDMRYGYASRGGDGFVPYNGGIVVPEAGVYHITGYLNWHNQSGTLPGRIEIYIGDETNYPQHADVSTVYPSGGAASRTYGQFHAVIVAAANASVSIQANVVGEDSGYAGTLDLQTLTFARIADIPDASALNLVTLVSQTGRFTTEYGVRLFSGDDGYTAQVRLDGGTPQEFTVPGTFDAATTTFTGLTPDTGYEAEYRVVLAGPTYTPWVLADVYYTNPNPPTGLGATPGAGIMDLVWTNAHASATTRIQRKTGIGGSWSTIHTAAAAATTYQDTGLAAATTYYYRVAHIGALSGFASDNSAEANGTTP